MLPGEASERERSAHGPRGWAPFSRSPRGLTYLRRINPNVIWYDPSCQLAEYPARRYEARGYLVKRLTCRVFPLD
jgi:hypothetical protein